MNPETPMIEVEEVHRSFSERPVLRGLSFSVLAGEFAVLSGRNGAGKSTLLRLLAGILLPDRGSIRVLGLQPREVMKKQRPAVGVFLPESFLYNDFTVHENMKLAAACCSEEEGQIERIASQLELEEHLSTRVRDASQGIRQRSGLARCFIGKRDLFLLDEPFSHLDSDSTERLRQLLRVRHADGATILCVLHDRSPLNDFPLKTLELTSGKIA